MRRVHDPRGRLERELSDLHAQWSESGGRSFVEYLVAHHSETYRALQRSLDLLDQLPRIVRRDWKRLRRRPIGKRTLAALMPGITEQYFRTAPRPPFSAYVRTLLRDYPTNAALRAFLRAGTHSTRKP